MSSRIKALRAGRVTSTLGKPSRIRAVEDEEAAAGLGQGDEMNDNILSPTLSQGHNNQQQLQQQQQPQYNTDYNNPQPFEPISSADVNNNGLHRAGGNRKYRTIVDVMSEDTSKQTPQTLQQQSLPPQQHQQHQQQQYNPKFAAATNNNNTPSLRTPAIQNENNHNINNVGSPTLSNYNSPVVGNHHQQQRTSQDLYDEQPRNNGSARVAQQQQNIQHQPQQQYQQANQYQHQHTDGSSYSSQPQHHHHQQQQQQRNNNNNTPQVNNNNQYNNQQQQSPPIMTTTSTPTPAVSKFTHLIINGHGYTLLNVLGKGGSGKVYFALRDDTGERFAIKEVFVNNTGGGSNNNNNNPHNLSNDNLAIQEEINLLLHLSSRTDRVVKLHEYEYRQDANVWYIVLELAAKDFGTILQSTFTNFNKNIKKQLILQAKEDANGNSNNNNSTNNTNKSKLSPSQQILFPSGLTLSQILYYWEQILLCVHACHELNILHLDLKPANFVMVDGMMKVIDFGIAKAKSQEMTSVVALNIMGTVSYMSPEHFLPLLQQQAQQQNDGDDDEQMGDGDDNNNSNNNNGDDDDNHGDATDDDNDNNNNPDGMNDNNGNNNKNNNNKNNKSKDKKTKGAKLRTTSDIWALGCIFHQMIFGYTPYADQHKNVHTRIAAVSSPEPYQPPQIQVFGAKINSNNSEMSIFFNLMYDIMKKCLQKDYKNRPSVVELLQHPLLCPIDQRVVVAEEEKEITSNNKPLQIDEQITQRAVRSLIQHQAMMYRKKKDDGSVELDPMMLPKEFNSYMLQQPYSSTFVTLLTQHYNNVLDMMMKQQQEEQRSNSNTNNGKGNNQR